jgi:hypothetical protein
MKSFSFVTDTATLCVFDVTQLKHRLQDDADWWSVPSEELLEVNKGNAVFVSIATDGKFAVRVMDDLLVGGTIVRAHLNVASGRVFVGAGEEVTSEGLEPECVRGGAFLELSPLGTYLVEIRRSGIDSIDLYFAHVSGSAENQFHQPLRI